MKPVSHPSAKRKQCPSLDMYDMVRRWHGELKEVIYKDFTMRERRKPFLKLPLRAQDALEALAPIMYLVEGELSRAIEEEKP